MCGAALQIQLGGEEERKEDIIDLSKIYFKVAVSLQLEKSIFL